MAGDFTVLNDEDLARDLDAETAVAWSRDAILAVHRGELLAPPRVHAELGDGRMAYTAGRLTGHWYGYRSYDTLPSTDGEQIVAVHSEPSGRVAGIVVGKDLGRMRTGAIGGVAADALAAPDATTVGIVGAGPHAWMQLWAINAVRSLSSVKVHCRTQKTREHFARNASERYGIEVSPAGSAEDAVLGADIVVLATNSGAPVVDSTAIGAGSYVTTLGPKQVGRAEFDTALAQRARLIATDSLPQLRAYDPPFVLRDTSEEPRIVSLGSVLAAEAPRQPGALFCSVGLAGTEAYLAARLLGV
ncbi:MAG: ornithine cyclodeaminase family protein [Stackebrandtia sp.]